MKLAVIGAGMMGRAALYDLSLAADVEQVRLFDFDIDRAREVARQYGHGKTEAAALDARDDDAVATVLNGCTAAVACTTYQHNIGLTQAAIKAGCHLVDLGGNHDVVNEQLALDKQAEASGVIVIPDCGLAPGMVSLMVADGVQKLDSVASARIRVGGLPQAPRPPLNYQIAFSVEGLINEYWEPCTVLEGGTKKTVNPMTGLEQLDFDGIGELEAFYTSGGVSTLPDTFRDQIEFLDYKTIRYPGHCVLFKAMLEIGLASRKPVKINGSDVEPRAAFKAVLDRNLQATGPDMILLRVTVEGERDGKSVAIVYESIDRQDSLTGLTAMMRCTAFPAAIIAKMAATGAIKAHGVKPQEVVVDPALFIGQLKRRGIKLEISEKTA